MGKKSKVSDLGGIELLGAWVPVIGRALCYLCLKTAGLLEKGIADQAELLEKLGLGNQDIAALTASTPQSVGELLRRRKKGAAKAKGKGTNRGKKRE